MNAKPETTTGCELRGAVQRKIVDALLRAGATSPETGIHLARLLSEANVSSTDFALHGMRIAIREGVVMPRRGSDGWLSGIHLCTDPDLLDEAADDVLKQADRLSGTGLIWREAAARMREDATADLEGVIA